MDKKSEDDRKSSPPTDETEYFASDHSFLSSPGSSRASVVSGLSSGSSSGSPGSSHRKASRTRSVVAGSDSSIHSKKSVSSSSSSSSSSSEGSLRSATGSVKKDHGEEDENKYPWQAEGEAEATTATSKEDDNFRDSPDYNYIQTYEDYLDHYVTWKDLYYFESDEIARTITTLGFRVPELLNREQFAKMMEDLESERFEKRRDDVHIALDVPEEQITCPLMQSLAEREVQNRTGNLSCLIYIRTFNSKKQEVSGWIDFRLRLKTDDRRWIQYFNGKKKLIPRPSDLCYYNWSTFQVRFNSSENYLVTTDINEGLQFLNKADRKLITVNPYTQPGDNTFMIKIKTENYLDCAIYDHYLRIKA